MDIGKILDLVSLLSEQPSYAGLFNPWRDTCELDAVYTDELTGPSARRDRLRAHLAADVRFILCGEACGYQGARYSGIAFTSEALLLKGAIPRVPSLRSRLTTRALPFAEPSATIVWKALHALRIAEVSVNFNTVMGHPHLPDDPWSNRRPTEDEVRRGRPALIALRDLHPQAIWVAVGRVAEQGLAAAGIPFQAVRHPANGGASLFAKGLANIVEATKE